MADFPVELSNIQPGSEIKSAHINNLEAKVGATGSAVTTSLDYKLTNPASLSPGHEHVPGDVGLTNVPDVDATNPSNINQDTTHRFVTDTEKSTWNGKEDPANKGQISGYAGLDGTGKVPVDQLPPGLPSVADWPAITSKPNKYVGDYAGATGEAKLLAAISAIGSNSATLYINVAITITTDLTIPSNIFVVFMKEHPMSLGTVPVTGNLTCAFTNGTNTITTRNNSAYISNMDSGILPGQYIKTVTGGFYYRVHHASGNDCIINGLVGASDGETSAFKVSPLVIGGTGLDTQFEHGDIVYVAGLTLPISRVKDSTHIWTYDWIPQEFNAAATRSVRVKFPGGIQAGQYQIFTGNGVAKLDHATTPTVHPEWWGATANGVNGDSDLNRIALNKMSLCFLHSSVPSVSETTAGEIELASGDYYVNGPVKYGCVTIRGTGSGTYTGKSCIRAAVTPFPGLAVMEPYPNLQAINTDNPNAGTYSGSPITTLEHFTIHSDYQKCANGYVVDSIVESGAIIINDINYQNGGCCVRSAGGNMKFVGGCFMSGMENGYFMANEGHIRDCAGQWGVQLVNSPDFSDGSKWTSTGWTLGASKATHTVGNTNSLTQHIGTQGGSEGYPYAPAVPMLIKLIISGGTAGTITLKSFGATILGTYGTAGTYYFWVNTPMDIWTNPLSVEIIPSTDFDKAVQVWIYYGGAFYGCSTSVKGNDFWSDGPLGAFGLYPTANYVRLSGNFIHPCAVGAVFESGKFYKNGLDSCLFGGIIGYGTDFVAKDNIFSTSGVGGMHIPSNMSITDWCIFTDNIFDNGAVPNFFGWSDGSHFPTGFSQLIIEDNLRADKGTKIAMEAGSATPSVLLGKRFSLDQSGGTNITNFTDGYDGKEIEVYFVDNLTTLKFSDGAQHLKGNNATDWTSVAGSILRATYNLANDLWYCQLEVY